MPVIFAEPVLCTVTNGWSWQHTHTARFCGPTGWGDGSELRNSKHGPLQEPSNFKSNCCLRHASLFQL